MATFRASKKGGAGAWEVDCRESIGLVSSALIPALSLEVIHGARFHLKVKVSF